jgi:hypothetical protein
MDCFIGVRYVRYNIARILAFPASLLMPAAIRAGAMRGSVSSEIIKQL